MKVENIALRPAPTQERLNPEQINMHNHPVLIATLYIQVQDLFSITNLRHTVYFRYLSNKL